MVKPQPPPSFADPLANAWAEADSAPKPAWENQLEQAFADAWSGGESQGDMESTWANLLQQAAKEGYVGSQMDQAWNELQQTPSPFEAPYELAKDNPYSKSANPYQEGLALFKEGRLDDAVLAFQATVTADDAHADAWRMLGVVHQENDEDRKAIICLERAVEQDAYHLDALLGLGVSYVNELDHERALKNLKAWVVGCRLPVPTRC
jgi:peroxin-5